MKFFYLLHWFFFERSLNLFDFLMVLTIVNMMNTNVWFILLYLPLGYFSHRMETWLKIRKAAAETAP